MSTRLTCTGHVDRYGHAHQCAFGNMGTGMGVGVDMVMRMGVGIDEETEEQHRGKCHVILRPHQPVVVRVPG